MISSIVSKLLEKTKDSKLTWKKNPSKELSYSAILDTKTIVIEQIVTVENNSIDNLFYLIVKTNDTIELIEKVSMGTISALIKEIRNIQLNSDFSVLSEEINSKLDNL